jgi:hypothetical protein
LESGIKEFTRALLPPARSTCDPCTRSQANGLLAGSGELAYCLCNKDVLDTTLSTIQNNPLARSAGVTGAAIQQV